MFSSNCDRTSVRVEFASHARIRTRFRIVLHQRPAHFYAGGVMKRMTGARSALILAIAGTTLIAHGSSHREAAFVTNFHMAEDDPAAFDNLLGP
jgi:hypothetical protein